MGTRFGSAIEVCHLTQGSMVHYVSVARGTTVIIEYSDAAPELCDVASKCLEKLPPLHSRFSYTAKRRTFICLIEDPFIYCAIVDEALGKANANSLLEQVRNEFEFLIKERGLPLDGEGFMPHCVDSDFTAIIRHLVAPFVETSQKEREFMEANMQAQQEAEADQEVTSPSAIAPSHEANEQELVRGTENNPSDFRSSFPSFKKKGNRHDKKKGKYQVKEVKEIMMECKRKNMGKEHKLHIKVEERSQPVPEFHIHKIESMRSKGQQLAQRMWWHNVRLALMLDAVVCLLLFAIWLGICRGISCIK